MSLADRWHSLHPEVPSTRELDASLAAALATSRSAYPEVEVPDDEFVAHLAARVAADALETVCVADLYFALALERGDRAALHAFETVYLANLESVILHFGNGTAFLDDVRNAVRERVLAHGGKAKIGEYHGRGDLRGWLRVVAVREALQLVRSRRREAPLPDDLATMLAVDPPASTAKEQQIYRDAFASALATLSARERNLLRQHYLHTATVAEIGAFYGVHGATAARWIAQIRQTLLDRTRRAVGDALRVTGTELDSAMAKAADHLDYSLRHTLSYER